MTPVDPLERFVVRPSPGLRVMSPLDLIGVLLFMACAGMLFAAMASAPPGSGDKTGLLLLAAVFALLALYRAGRGIVQRLPLVVAKDGRATLWRWQLSLTQPKQVSFEHEYRTWYRTCIQYGNGRLLALTHHGYRSDEAFAIELATFLSVPIYQLARGQKPRKLTRKTR